MRNAFRFALAAALLAAAPACAADYPDRTITMVVPFAAGGLSDVPARIMAGVVADRLHPAIAPFPRRADRRRQGDPEQDQLRNLGSGALARHGPRPAQRTRQDVDRR